MMVCATRRCDEECADCCNGGAVSRADRGCTHPAQPRQVGLDLSSTYKSICWTEVLLDAGCASASPVVGVSC